VQKAIFQRKVAEGLTSSIKPWKGNYSLRVRVLEVGCGTGFLSELMMEEFPER